MTTFKHQLDCLTEFQAPTKIEPQDTYGLFLFKHGPADWAFHMPKHGKINELLTCGTEKALDYWYQKLSGEWANYQSEMFCTISTQKLPIEAEPTCTLYLMGEHPEKQLSHNYYEPESEEICWLCEYGTQMGLGGAKELYLYLTLTNPGPLGK